MRRRNPAVLVPADPLDPYDPGSMELAIADVVVLLGELAEMDECPGCGMEADIDAACSADHTDDCPLVAMLKQLEPYREVCRG